MKKYKGIIFDLDGTLLNTIEDLTDSVNDVMEIYHFPKHDTKACKMMVGNGFRKLITRALPIEKQKDEQFIDEVQAEFAKAYHKRYLNKTVPYDGILEMIKELECNGVQTAVNSNKRSDYADIPMAAVYGERESEGIPKKPDPSAALEIANKMELTPDEILYIGDSKTDMKTGQNAGMDTIGVAWGFRGPEELKEHQATYIVEKPQDILRFVL